MRLIRTPRLVDSIGKKHPTMGLANIRLTVGIAFPEQGHRRCTGARRQPHAVEVLSERNLALPTLSASSPSLQPCVSTKTPRFTPTLHYRVLNELKPRCSPNPVVNCFFSWHPKVSECAPISGKPSAFCASTGRKGTDKPFWRTLSLESRGLLPRSRAKSRWGQRALHRIPCYQVRR